MAGGEFTLVRSLPRTPWRGRRPPVRLLVRALLDGDRTEAVNVCDRFLARTGRRVAVFADLLHPAQYELGDIWYRGMIGEEQELQAAALVGWLVDRLPATPTASVPAGWRCMLCLAPGDRHELGARMFALALEDDGWKVELADLEDLEDLAAAAERARPRLAAISAGHLPSAVPLARSVAAVRELGLPVLVGGAVFNRSADLWRRVGADGWGADARVGTVLARRLGRA